MKRCIVEHLSFTR